MRTRGGWQAPGRFPRLGCSVGLEIVWVVRGMVVWVPAAKSLKVGPKTAKVKFLMFF